MLRFRAQFVFTSSVHGIWYISESASPLTVKPVITRQRKVDIDSVLLLRSAPSGSSVGAGGEACLLRVALQSAGLLKNTMGSKSPIMQATYAIGRPRPGDFYTLHRFPKNPVRGDIDGNKVLTVDGSVVTFCIAGEVVRRVLTNPNPRERCQYSVSLRMGVDELIGVRGMLYGKLRPYEGKL